MSALIQQEMTAVRSFNMVEAVVTNMEELAETQAVSVLDADSEENDFHEQIRPKTISSEIVYYNVYDGVDIKYNLYGLDIKESIIINEPQENYIYSFSFYLDGLVPELDEETGVISLMDGDKIAYEMPAPYMFDAEGITSNNVAYGLAEVGNGQYIVVVSASEDWINDEERVFPVTIDPTLTSRTEDTDDPITTTHTTYGSPDTTHTDYQNLYIGYSSVPSYDYCYIYLNVNTLPEIPKNCVITDARIMLACYDFDYWSQDYCHIRAYEVAGDDCGSYTSYRHKIRYMTYNNAPSTIRTALDTRQLDNSCEGKYVEWDVVRAAQGWYETSTDQKANHAIKLEATSLQNNVVVVFKGYGTNSPAYFVVSYRNTVGVEDYHTYQTQGVDRAGTAYVSDFTQQLTLIHPDVSINIGKTSYTLSHVYNSANSGSQFTNSAKEGIHTRDFGDMDTGLGWKLSAQETIKYVYLSESHYLVYNDADGTEHYFPLVKDEGSIETYEDEDGLGLTAVRRELSDGTPVYTVTDKDAYITKVFYDCILTSITDSNGNAVYFAYNNPFDINTVSSDSATWKPAKTRRQLKQIVQVTDGADQIVLAEFHYNDPNNEGFLSKITEFPNTESSRETTFTYTNGMLTTITHPDGTKANYEYDADGYMTSVEDNESGYGLSIGYTANYLGGKIINEVREFAASGEGNGYSIERDTLLKMHYIFYGADHVQGGTDDLLVYNLFDYFGRTITSYTMDYEGEKLYGASSTAYKKTEGTSRTNNHIESAAVSGAYSENILKDGDIERSSSSTSWTAYGVTSNAEIGDTGTNDIKDTSGDSIKPHLGYNMIALSGVENGTVGMEQSVSLVGGTTYTFSGYVKTDFESLPQNGGGAYLAFIDGNGLNKGTIINYNTLPEIDDGWEKISVTYTPETSGTYSIAICVTDAAGVVCGDDFQLEEGSVATSTNLIQGASFEDYNYAYSKWGRNTDSYITQTSTNAWRGGRSMALTGIPGGIRYCYQNVQVNQPAEDKTFILSGWACGSSTAYPQYSDRRWELTAIIYYNDSAGTKEYHRIAYNYANTDWQYGSLAIVPKVEDKSTVISKIEVCMMYYYGANTVYYDDLCLVMEPSQSYSYDEDGNLVSAKDANGKTAWEYYDDTEILKSYTDLSGVSYSMTYEGTTHNLLTTTSDGVTVTNTYDGTVGNVTSTKTTTEDGQGKHLLTTSTYSADGNYLTGTESVNGVAQSFTYDSTTHAVASSTVEDGYTQKYMYEWGNGRIANTSINGVIDLDYGYENGLLTTLTRTTYGTGAASQRYVMEHDSFGNTTEISVKKGDASRTLANYDYAGNNGLLEKMTYGNDDYIVYGYDLFDRVTEQKYYNYDEEQAEGVLAETYHYDYNAEGDLYRQYETGGNTYEFQYDTLGRLLRSKETDIDGDLIQRTAHTYDSADRLTAQSWVFGDDTSYTESYQYDADDGSLSVMETAAGTEISFGYDALKRLTSETTSVEGQGIFAKNYDYHNLDGERTTLLVSELEYTVGGDVVSGHGYTYDSMGNISSVKDCETGDTIVSYTYDGRDQLLSEAYEDKTYTYTYDAAGNILTASNGTSTNTYTYGDDSWADLLTKYNNVSLTYDAIGNPTSYYNGASYTMTWAKGRQLDTLEIGNVTLDYEYDMDGIRQSKDIEYQNGTTSQRIEYITQSGLVVRQSEYVGEQNDLTRTIDFIYDSQQRPYALVISDHTGTSVTTATYYYLLNLQGDVVGLLNASGNLVVEYTYNAWGEVLSVAHTTVNNGLDSTIGVINPLRYRSYYFDSESGFYYLQSRYYDPSIGRFINADSLLGNDLSGGLNLFAYCGNNPICYSDPSGHFFLSALLIGAIVFTVGIVVAAISTTIYENQQQKQKQNYPVETLREQVQSINDRHPGNYYVYTLSDPETNQVQYVGRTNDIDRRRKEHETNLRTQGLDMHSYMGGLTYSEARALEQQLMIAYHTLKASGSGGRNSINGISPNNPKYDAYFQALDDFVYNEVSNEYYCLMEIFPYVG